MEKRYLYLETYGCQMNEYDSARIRNALGLELTENPKKADVIILNTCSIREKADQKALSSLGRFKNLKAKNPNLIIGMGGCVAQLYGEKLLDRMPHLDLVFGTRTIPLLPKLISDIEEKKRRRTVETSFDIEDVFEIEPYHEEGKVTAYVSVQQGCNKFCIYCIVPTVRGKEVNRPVEDIEREVNNLIKKGVKEITLIGQTVNSYRRDGVKFSQLLWRIAEIEGLLRIRFTTSYPRDVSGKLIEAMRDIPKLCKHIHLPVQSGSNRVLKRMKRTYARESYMDIVRRLRDAVPDIAITTDIIVGFPGETEEDFNNTMTLLEEVEFDGTFSFNYSPRPGTEAATYTDQIPWGISNKRLIRLQELQGEITKRKNVERVGRVEEVLVEGLSRNDPGWISGRTTQNRVVNFPGDRSLTSRMVKVRITEGFQNSLRGKLEEINQGN